MLLFIISIESKKLWSKILNKWKQMFRTFPSESKRVGRGSSLPRFCLLYKAALTCLTNLLGSSLFLWFLILFQFVFFVYYDLQGGPNHWVAVDGILRCNHSNESCWTVLSCGTVYNAVQGCSNFWVCGWNPKVWPFKWKLLSSTFLWYYLLRCTRWF